MSAMSPTVVSLPILLKVFLLALFWRASCSQLLRKDLYVTTEQDNTCPTGPNTCLSIADYLHGNQHLFASNTTLHFLPGQHIVNGSGTDSSTVVIADLTDFGVEGLDVPTGEQPVVTVQCSHPVNFHFTNITRLHIQNIKFIHCSPTYPTFNLHLKYVSSFPDYLYGDNSGSLELENLRDLVLHNVHITESSGFGLVGLNLLGTTTVRYCHFYNNSGLNASANTPGGNALLCSTEYNSGNKIEVSKSKFASGSNPIGSGGLDIIQENGTTSIQIINCNFSRNRGYVGADISLRVISYIYKMEIKNSSFQNSVSVREGGSCYIEAYSFLHLHFSHSIFTGNSASMSGGAVYISGSSLLLSEEQLKFTDCYFSENRAEDGGAVYISGSSLLLSEEQLKFTDCYFSDNRAEDGGAIYSRVSMSASQCVFHSNTASFDGFGGGVYFSLSTNLSIINCTFVHNTAGDGGGLSIINSMNTEVPANVSAYVLLKNSSFIENKARHHGGAMYTYNNHISRVKFHTVHCHFNRNSAQFDGGISMKHILSYEEFHGKIIIDINNTQFQENTANGRSSAISVTGYLDKGHDCHRLSNNQLTFTIAHGYFANNAVYPLSSEASTIIVDLIQSFHLVSSKILSNNGSAIHAYESEILFEGDVVIADNTAYIGGALYLDCDESPPPDCRKQDIPYVGSIAITGTNSSLLIRNNKALGFGGGIAQNERCGPLTYEFYISLFYVEICFFNLLEHNSTTIKHLPVVVHMEGNKALIAGNVFYGGPLETCIYSQNPKANSIQMFRSIFTNNRNLSTMDVVSDPIRVCFCIQQVTEGPYCLNEWNITAYRGEDFTVSAIAVAHLTDTSPMFVMAELHIHNNRGQLGTLQKSQELNRSCAELTYSVRTLEDYAKLYLTLINYPQSKISFIHIHFRDCPFGFELTEDPPKCDCDKHLTLAVPQITCDINSYSVHLPSSAWVGNFSGGIVAHPNCPHDYCNISYRQVGVDNQDAQCSHNHSGVLCGSCLPGLSLALGSSHCLQCSNIFLLLLLPFAVSGILLVIMLQKCNLTVSKGMINGLIFYANMIQVNKAYFFPQNNRLWLTKFLAAFIAWLNLDLGIETCFADGLKAITRVWLQFLFPAYVWIIVGTMIFTSRYSVTASKLTGSNAVPVLATLFLLSYTKLLRAVIAAVSPIAITDQNATPHLLWATDGNVAFLHGAHIPLFLMAVLMTAVYIVPLTTLVTLAPYIQARSQHKFLRWVVRIKPLLDAYTGPYTDKHRYWTGFMLLTRILLFIAFTANSTGDPKLNLLFINGVVAGVLVLQRYAGKLYKNSINRALEVFYLLNLLFLSAITLFLRGHYSATLAQEITVCTMVGVSFLLFIFTLCWHMYSYAIPRQVRQKLTTFISKFNKRPPHSAEDTAPVQGTQTQPTVSVIDMSELREPLLTDN